MSEEQRISAAELFNNTPPAATEPAPVETPEEATPPADPAATEPAAPPAAPAPTSQPAPQNDQLMQYQRENAELRRQTQELMDKQAQAFQLLADRLQTKSPEKSPEEIQKEVEAVFAQLNQNPTAVIDARAQAIVDKQLKELGLDKGKLAADQRDLEASRKLVQAYQANAFEEEQYKRFGLAKGDPVRDAMGRPEILKQAMDDFGRINPQTGQMEYPDKFALATYAPFYTVLHSYALRAVSAAPAASAADPAGVPPPAAQTTQVKDELRKVAQGQAAQSEGGAKTKDVKLSADEQLKKDMLGAQGSQGRISASQLFKQ